MYKFLALAILAASAQADWLQSYRVGETLLAGGQASDAIEAFKLALGQAEAVGASSLQFVAIHDAMGRAAFGGGQYRNSRKHFERALSSLAADGPPEARAPILANLGQACQELGELARARMLYREALEAVPDRGAVWNSLGGVLFLERRYDEAEDAHRRAMTDPRAAAAARNNLAVVLEARGKLREAAALIAQSIPSAPAGQPRARMLANLGGLQLKLGNGAEAAAALRRSLEEMESAVGPAHPDVARILESYGHVLRKTGRKTEAKVAARRAETIRASFAGQTNADGTTVDYRDLK